MKRIILLVNILFLTVTAFAQFPDTASLNQYIRDTLKDRRPQKVTVAQIQKAFLGVTSFLNPGGDETVDTLTRDEATDLMEDSLLELGKLYCIINTDATLYGGTNIVLRAISSTAFSTDGIGHFRNPDYLSESYPIWEGELTYMTVNTTSGAMIIGEGIATAEGATGVWINNSMAFTSTINGAWPTGTFTVTGQWSGAEAEIVIEEFPAYETNQYVIWGGRVWKNLTGNRGYKIDDFELNDDDWQVVPYSSNVYYKSAVDPIKYDWANDRIIGRKEESADNEVYTNYYWIYNNYPTSAIKSFQWGNPFRSDDYKGIGAQKIYNSINKNINFRGQYQQNIEISNESSQDIYFDANSGQSNIKFDYQSQQSSMFLFNSYQSRLNFYSAAQSSAVLSESNHEGFTFIRAYQQNFNQQGFNQENINLWGFDWDRSYALLESSSEQDIYKFGEPDEGGDAPEDQSFLRFQTTDVSTIYQSSSVVYGEDLEFETEAESTYAFEYELYLYNYIPFNTMVITVDAPENQTMMSYFTFTNITDTIITTSIVSGSATASTSLNNQGDYFHVRISGIIIGTDEGSIKLGINPISAPYGGEFTLLTGSFAKFTKYPYYPPPVE